MDLSPIDISASGMRAQRVRMNLVALNLAHADTTSVRTETGTAGETRHVPFRRKVALFAAGPVGSGVVARAGEDGSAFRAEHDPGHPHAVREGADKGYVYFPNVHPMTEMVEMIAASRAYEANVSAVDTFKAMTSATLRILA